MLKDLFTDNGNRIYWKLLSLIILTTLLYLTLTPSPPQPLSISHIDKLYHFIAFTSLAFAFSIAFSQFNSLFILFIAVFIGVATEIAQFFVPGRGFSIADIIADGSGAYFGFWIASKTEQRIIHNKQIPESEG